MGDSTVRFARHTHDNLQSLIRFGDGKAGALTAYIFVLSGIGYPVIQETGDKLRFSRDHWYQIALDIAFCAAWFVFFVGSVAIVLILLLLVVRPRFAEHYANHHKSHDLMFWEHILLHNSNASYHDAVQKLDEAAELRNITNQIYELAHIASAKMRWLKIAGNYLLWVTISWLAGIIFGFFVIVRG